MATGNNEDTVEIPPPRNASEDRPPPFSALTQVDVAGLSHVGCVRPSNEDHFLICRFGRVLETMQTNLPDMAAATREVRAGLPASRKQALGMGGKDNVTVTWLDISFLHDIPSDGALA